MTKRWLIRDFFMLLLGVCVVAWVGSYWRWVLIRLPAGRADVWCWGASGALIVERESTVRPQGWLWLVVSPDDRARDSFNITYQFAWFHAMGFAFDGRWVIFVPLWFPALLSALFLWFVWRKTRPKPAGSPVEPAAKSGDPPR